MDKCPDQLSAKLIVDSNGHTRTLHAFGSILLRIADASSPADVTQETLLNSKQLLKITYNDNNVITSVNYS